MVGLYFYPTKHDMEIGKFLPFLFAPLEFRRPKQLDEIIQVAIVSNYRLLLL